MVSNFSRRSFSSLLLSSLLGCWRLRAEEKPSAKLVEKHRKLLFVIDDGFGNGLAENIEAVLRSAAESIWQHCPSTHWQTSGFRIYPNEKHPICHFDHSAQGEVVIGLATKDTFWAQYAFQFAHEFCHALIGHTNDWRKRNLRDPGPQFWLEECLCEVASLFALRTMAESWKTEAPYPNWADFSPHLKSYADERIGKAKNAFPEPFLPWFGSVRADLQKNPTMREHNCRVAAELLPIWEEHPSIWDAMQSYRVNSPAADQSLEQHFTQWKKIAASKHHAVIDQIGKVFGV